MLRKWIAFALLVATSVATPARADDFVSDLAQCAKAPIVAASFATDDLKTAATFIAQHGECVPMVTSGDPLLYGLSPTISVLQQQGVLGQGTQACIDDTLGKASREMSGVLSKFADAAPMSTLVPSKSRQLLLAIANGQSNEPLYSVPGLTLIVDHISCGCAVASSAMDINKLKDRIHEVLETIGSCKNVVGKLLGKAYDIAAAGYGAAKDAVNSLGCTFGLGGCSSGPPFFCSGYFSLRAQHQAPDQIVAIFPDVFQFKSWAQDGANKCEPQWQAKQDQLAREAAQKAADELLEKELAKAEKLGSANALGFAFRWSPKCSDEPCKVSIAKISDQYNADIHDPATIKQYVTFTSALRAMEKKYGDRAELAIILSKDRHDKALRDNVNAPVGDRLAAFGCKLFLARPMQSLCKGQKGFDVCADYVRSDKWQLCAQEGHKGVYSAGRALDQQLRLAGCIPERVPGRGRYQVLQSDAYRAQCLSDSALMRCEAFADGKSAVSCSGAPRLTFDRSRLPTRLQPISLTPLQPVSPIAPVRPVLPVAPIEPIRPIRVVPGLRPRAPQAEVPKSTLCAFEEGPRAGQQQDYAPMDPLPVGTPCHDGRGSTGHVIAN